MTAEHIPGSLTEFVTEELKKAGHPSPDNWKSRLHQDAATVTDESVERFLVNRALRTEIGLFEEQTTETRYCLIDTGKTSDWKRLVSNTVVPCMLRNSK